MKLEFIRPFCHWSIGQTIDPPEGQAQLMIQRGWCKPYEEKKQPEISKKQTKTAK